MNNDKLFFRKWASVIILCGCILFLSLESRASLTPVSRLGSLIIQEKTFVVLYKATWCRYCKMIQTALMQIDRHEVEVIFIDIDHYKDHAKEEKLFGVPAMDYYHKGKKISREYGYKTITELQKLFDNLKERGL